MSAFFDKFDPKVRLAMWAGLSLISLVAGWAVLSKMATGPWPALLVAAALAAIGLSMQGEAWPSKPPAWANEFIEKWKKMRSRSTKSAAGKFAWNLGRSAVAGICMWFALEQFADVSGFLAKAMILGFAVSTGFFGAGPAAWSGMVVFLVGHRLALMGLNVDFADPNSRAALDAAWSAGGAMSWWWAIGLAVAAPIWIFLSFLSRVLSTKLLDEYEEIRAAKEAKRKIDARRARLKQREEAEETDELITARLARESAERRVASVARGKDGALPNAGGAGGTEDEGEEELSAVEKLMEVKNVGQLEQYIEHAKSILQSEKDGIDVDTVGRRSFDRVVEAMDDTQLKLLRKGDLPGWEALDQYYNKLCGIEYNAMAGGDGEVITMQGERSEAAVGSGYEDDSVIGDVMTEMETLEADAAAPSVSEDEDAPLGDVLDHESGEAPVHRRTSAADEIESMLAEPKSAASVFREGPDGTPEGDVELPAASQSDNEIEESPDVPAAEGTAETEEMPMVEESEEEYSSVDRIDDIKSDAGEDDFDAFNELGDDSDDEPGLGEPVGSFDEPVDVRDEPEASSGVEDETSEEVGDDADEPASEEDHFDDFLAEQDVADADADFGPDGLIEDDVEGDEPETEANTSADAANAEGETDDGEGVDATGVAAVVEAEATPEHEWEIEPKRAASRIIMRKIDRDLVLKTVGMFETIDAMADTLGLPADELDDVFEEYQAQVEGAKVEQSLDGLVSAEDVDGVREALAALEASSWEADSDAVARASAFIEAKEEEARQAEEKRLAEEQRKREEEEAERERLEAERIAEEERKREEEAAAARAEEERKEAEAEAARLAELEKDRMKHGIHLLSGQYDEELLSVGGDLFPDVETLASTLGVETRVVEKQFGVFEAKRIAKEKFEALNAAWKERDLGLVLTLLDDTSDMDAYDDPDDMISHIKSWAESEKRRQEVAGLTEKVDIGKSSQGDENQKKFIVKRCKTTDEQIDIIENLLPNALSLAESLGRVRAAMGSSAPPVMKEEEDKAVMQAARLAAMLTAEERQCKEYTMAFFPAEDGVSGPKVWDRIEAFAARSDGKAAAIERADANASSEAPKEGEKPQFAQIAIPQDSGPKLRSYEELLEADVQEEIRKIATPKVEELDWYNREYRRKFISFVNDPKDDFDVTPSGFFDVKVADGVVRLHTPLKKMPLWFEARPNDKAGDIVHVMEVVDGVSTLSTLPASVIHKQFSSHFGGESKVSAVILVSPAISQEGIRTFEKFLSGIRGGPVIILNSNLKEDDISAFLERLKNA